MEISLSGVVLREQCRATPSFSVFTEELGRLVVRDRSLRHGVRLQPGHGVHMVLLKQGGQWTLRDRQLLFVPDGDDSGTLFWHHHLLELYFYFVPLEQPQQFLFAHLCQILRAKQAPDAFWQLAVARFLAHLGYGVPTPLAGDIALFNQALSPLTAIDGHLLREVPAVEAYQYHAPDREQWITKALRSHPYAGLLKTTNFFARLYPQSEVEQ